MLRQGLLGEEVQLSGGGGEWRCPLPTPVKDYNKNMGEVDHADAILV